MLIRLPKPDLIFEDDDFPLVKVSGHQILENIHGATILQRSVQSIVYLVEYTGLQDQPPDLLSRWSVVEKKAVIKVFNKDESELAEREYKLANRLKGDLGGKKGIGMQDGEFCPEYIFKYYYDKNNPNVIISDTEMNIVPYNEHPAISTHYSIARDTVDRLIRGERHVDTVISQIFSIIDCIHQAGFYHRDIKPQNFVISNPGGGAPPEIHLIDFGFSLRDDELGTDKVFYVNSTTMYLSPFMIRAKDLNSRPAAEQKEILIANDYWGAICTIIYYLNNKPWWEYTDYSKNPGWWATIDRVITAMPSTPTNELSWQPAKQPTDPIFKIFNRFFYHMLPPPPGGGPPRERTVKEYIDMIQSIMFPPSGGGMRGRKKRTKKRRTRRKKSKDKRKKSKSKRKKYKSKRKKSKTLRRS